MSIEQIPAPPKDGKAHRIYHNGGVPLDIKALQKAGWDVVDVRLLPETTLEERVEAVQAWLAGIRFGTIIPPRGAARFLELEARILGLIGTQKLSGAQADSLPESTRELLRAIGL